VIRPRSSAVRDDRGATAVEYSLLIALIAAVIFGVVMLLGQHTTAAYSTVVAKF
jgi:pilus assembly protein Flp/PilA